MGKFLRMAAFALPVIALLAYGGGGVSDARGKGVAPLPVSPLPGDFPVGRREAMRLTGGAPAPNLAPEQIRAMEAAKMKAADTVLLSDIFVTSRDGAATVIPTDLLPGNGGADPNLRTVMVRHGVMLYGTVAPGQSEGERLTGYGGWLDGSIFATVGGSVSDAGVAFGMSAGAGSGSDPGGAGSRAWSGVMVGRFLDGAHEVYVFQADARVDIDDLSAPDVDADFPDSDDDKRRSDDDIVWSNLAVEDGAFAAADGSMEGRFYGEGHEEVGGVFNLSPLRSSFIGAFGAAGE